MGWKNWPYWVKGGIISMGIVGFFALVLLFVIRPSIPGNPLDTIFLMPIRRITFFLNSISPSLGNAFDSFFVNQNVYLGIFDSPKISGVIFALLVYFLVGALVGWIYGKIKNR